MTGRRKTPVVERWLDRQRAVLDGFGTVLDVEAGLREVLLLARTVTVTDDFGTVLDVEAGLREVLPADPLPLSVWSWADAASDAAGKGSSSVEKLLPSVRPQARLRLRARPDVASAYRILVLSVALDRYLTLDLALALGHDVAHAQARVLMKALTRTLELARELASALGPAGAQDPDLFRVLTLALALTLESARRHGLKLVRGDDIAAVRGLAHDVFRQFPPSSVTMPEHVSTLLGTLDHALDRHHEVDRDDCRTLGGALAHVHGSASGLARGGVHGPAAIHVLARGLVRIRVERVKRVIGSVLDRTVPDVDADFVEEFLNDFTTSDLRRADLDGLDLGGVRWSTRATRWPEVVDIEHLKARSKETFEGSGVWTVQCGTATVEGAVASP
ncbi:hypothetical protein [Streptomyces sp. NPDC016845]|uniref:hypothetical protein n=1 Tax=Streptomyces sp. NPDC016845 TaxID=3364972 RepID=UPI0037943D5F